MATTYQVVKGDTLSEIAVRFGTTVSKLVSLNNIKDPDFIVVGQTLQIDGTASTPKKKVTNRATVTTFGLQSNTDRTLYAVWTWNKDNTDHFEVVWAYDTGDGVWFTGSSTTTEDNQSLYTAPNNAVKVRFKVKPVAESSNSFRITASSSSWTADWSTYQTHDFRNDPPGVPDVPNVKIEKYTLTASLNNIDLNADSIYFVVVKDNGTGGGEYGGFAHGLVKINAYAATFTCTVDPGHEYKVRACAYKDTLQGKWSDYSENVATIPETPKEITTCKAKSKTSVYLEWSAVNTATSYELEYTTKLEYFDGSNQTTKVSSIEFTHYELTGLTSGEEYFFRVRAVNSVGSSGWSGSKSVAIGKDPEAPTTWSSTTTAIVGEPLNLYWVHNSEDGSSQTYAELELTINGNKETHTIKNSTEEDEKDKTSVYAFDTSLYIEGTKLQWRVRTAGVTKVYGDWSIERTVDIYAPPTLELKLTDKDGNSISTLESFPFYVSGLAGPNTQMPIGYYLNVSANESYETVDQVGNKKVINAGGQVYSKYFDTSDPLLVEMSAGNIDLVNNIAYKVTCLVSMNSGLTVEASLPLTVAWTDEEYAPNAEITIDSEALTAFIRPYCEDIDGNLIEDILLSVYRREYDGRFTELATGIDNLTNTHITDPHPALDFARYRIVAITKSTGAVSYFDVPGVPVDCSAVVIQWDEDWSNFDVSEDGFLEEHPWSGSMLKLPYNIQVSSSHAPDVALVEYIGREHPVAYYGTQLGETGTWNVDIDKNDKETLYGIRRLAKWMGNVYVREPSGSGYWANIVVSFGEKYNELTIPITFNVARVEGGV